MAREPTVYRQPLTPEDEIELAPPPTSGDSSNDVPEKDYRDFVIPEDRKLGVVSTTLLIVNRVVGTGIFSTPSFIIANTDSVGASLIFWVLGGVLTVAGMFVYLEFGTALPRSGGEKVYLERVYRRPRYLATSVFAVQFILFAVSTGNSVSFSSYLLKAINPDFNSLDASWTGRAVAAAAITVVCLIHSFIPKTGIWLSNGLGAFKIVLLLLVVCTGFATLAGSTQADAMANFQSFDGEGSAPSGTPLAVTRAARYALALNQVMYSYSGWENANYVLTEVRNAPRTLKIAAPLAVTTVTILYFLANVSYFAAMSKTEIADSGVTVAAKFFENAWGKGSFATRVMPLFVAISALGNVFAQSFAMPRVKQELAKEGFLPFSKFWASDWPFSAPTGAIFLHWIFTVAFILGSNASNTYAFVTAVFIYTGIWIKVLLGIGLLYLTFAPQENWKQQRTSFRSSPALTVFWIVSLLYVIGAPFIPNKMLDPIPWYTVPVLGTSMIAVGIIYWGLWAKLAPMFGFHIMHEVEVLPDGSERDEMEERLVE
ncbi:amino acid transporter [Zalerion maritima]|uniref:Amino acid transporter n=1 Tax=Zalerion maritima TaxID=339359 RepID=A0AAD5RZ22_9PEZI|nr:amino acid transporter [Zalerion maritima]